MNRLLIPALVLATASGTPSALHGQEWSAEEQDLFDHIETCWESKALEDYAETVKICNISGDIVYWPASESEPPSGLDWHFEANERVFEAQDLVEDEFRPLRVARHGETFLVFYLGRRVYTDSSGGRVEARWKGLDVWERGGSGWTMVAGMDAEVR